MVPTETGKTYGFQAGGAHPTGMLSCLSYNDLIVTYDCSSPNNKHIASMTGSIPSGGTLYDRISSTSCGCKHLNASTAASYVGFTYGNKINKSLSHYRGTLFVNFNVYLS